MANTDDENLSELTDDDKLDGLTRYPPDAPLGVNDRGVTDAEDSVEERARRENPDRWSPRWTDEVDQLIDDAGEGGIDAEGDAVAHEARHERDPLGTDLTVQDLEEVEPAEEAAMHLTEDPPMGDDDGYLEDEPGS